MQHAHNPVDWFPWSAEAFAKAKSEKKLVFLSIGYSSCHWCHVMERESFSNKSVAELMNRSFVCIKVDREERPDIDAIYMAALNVQGSRGGWPLSMFLTADGKPIVGGTYWPPEDKDVPEGTVRGFKSILQLMEQFQKNEPAKLVEQADKLAEGRDRPWPRRNLAKPSAIWIENWSMATVENAGRRIRSRSSAVLAQRTQLRWFQVSHALQSRFARGRLERSQQFAAEMLVSSLDQIAWGGINDHVEGGFHRYSTERSWTVPHFEKMLYDNGQLLEIYARAYALTDNEAYKRDALETAEFIKNRLTSPDGVFYASLDADSEGSRRPNLCLDGSRSRRCSLRRRQRRSFPGDLRSDGAANFEEKFHILRMDKSLERVGKGKERQRTRIAREIGALVGWR